MTSIIYTALFGPYEELKEPSAPSPGWEFVCFTDQPVESKTWKIRKSDPSQQDARWSARQIKILPHRFLPEAERTIWLDASFQINTDMNIVWHNGFNKPFSCPSHPVRNDVYSEVRSCISNGRGNPAEVQAQGEEYKRAGVPAFNGLITSGLLLRMNTPEVNALNEEWWAEMQGRSSRDQIAFARASLKHTHIFSTFKWDYSQSKELKHVKHFHLRH